MFGSLNRTIEQVRFFIRLSPSGPGFRARVLAGTSYCDAEGRCAMPDAKKVIKAHCNNCGPHRNHSVLFEREVRWDDDDIPISGGDHHYMLSCNGCDRITFRTDSWNEFEADDAGQPETRSTYYPPAISRKEPEWVTSSDSPFFLDTGPIPRLMKEIYSAVQNDSRALAVMGVRALIEHIMIEQLGDSGSIGSNVDRFIAEGYIARKAEALFREYLIESGHAAMHRAYFPKPTDISALLDIAESIIETIYIHPYRAKGEAIPPRKQRKKPDKKCT
jgi:hypothetical protein